MVHPLYIDMQIQSPLGLHRGYKIAEYDQSGSPISAKELYTKHVARSLPCILRNEMKENQVVKDLSGKNQSELDIYVQDKFSVDHAAIIKWFSVNSGMDDKYGQALYHHLDKSKKSEISLKYTRLIRREERDLFWRTSRQESKTILAKYSNFTRDKETHPHPKYVHFIEDLPLGSNYMNWKGDDHDGKHSETEENEGSKNPLRKFLSPVNKLYTQWRHFEGRTPKKLLYEQHICVLHGTEKFVLVSPIFRKNIYVNVLDNQR